jgi:NADPH:quinone reductase
MFARSTFQTADMVAQHNLLADVSRLVDEGIIHTTLGTDLGSINAANLRRAHQLVETGRGQGKIVLAGF